MARTKKIALGEEYKRTRALGAYGNSLLLEAAKNLGWYNPHEKFYFGATQLEEQAIIEEARKARAAAGNPRWGYNRYMGPAVKNHFLRRGYSQNMASALSEFVSSNGWGETNGDQRLMSFQMMNEFLAQDEFDRYGDFLDEKWDELYAKATEFTFNEYSWSVELLKENYATNLLSFRPRLPKVAQKELEDLTKGQIIALRKLPSIKQSIPNKDARARLKSALAVMNGEQSVSVSPTYIINTFMRAFSKTAARVNATTSLDLASVYESFAEALKPGRHYLTSERAESAADKLFTNDVARYADFLLENAEEFTLSEMFFACITWNETRLIARTGTRADVLNFFLSVMDTYKDDKGTLLDFFKMVGEAGALYNGEVPTMTHWKNALKNGYLEGILGAEMTLTLIAGSDKTVSKLDRQRIWRRVLKGDS